MHATSGGVLGALARCHRTRTPITTGQSMLTLIAAATALAVREPSMIMSLAQSTVDAIVRSIKDRVVTWELQHWASLLVQRKYIDDVM